MSVANPIPPYLAVTLSNRPTRAAASSYAAIRTAAHTCGLSLHDILGASRRQRVAVPRMAAMALARDVTGLTLAQIGRAFCGRDHTTVVNACQRPRELLAKDMRINSVYVTMRKSMEGHKRAYISGPISGVENNNAAAFAAAKAAIDAVPGWIGINPLDLARIAELDRRFADLSAKRKYAAYMRIDIANLTISDALVMLPGCEASAGAQAEIGTARTAGIPVHGSVDDFLASLQPILRTKDCAKECEAA